MRYVNTVLCLLMLVFGAVQYNDPDGATWMAIYLVPAVWAGLAVWRGEFVARRVPGSLLLACLALALAGVVRCWPRTPRWWAQEVWYEVETAREGMGLMVVAIVLGVVWLTGRLAVRRGGGPGDASPGADALGDGSR